MKRLLSLSLSFVICCSGLISLGAPQARGQGVASVSNLDTLRQQYEQMLAVERNAATPPEVRELNRTFLEERRAQLAAAIRNRIGALSKYRAAVADTLSDAEKGAIDGSVARLTAELQALLPEAVPAAAAATRRTRRPARAAPTAPSVEASFTPGPPVADAEPAAPTPAAEPRPAADAPRPVDAIQITSPASDSVVHTSEVELVVSLNDDQIDDILVAVYTPASDKPVSARNYEVKRSNRGVRAVVVALSKGDNRIEVSDLKRGEVKAVRVITYTPPSDIPLGTARLRTTASGTVPADAPPAQSGPVKGYSRCLYGYLTVTPGGAASPLRITVKNTPPGETTAHVSSIPNITLKSGKTEYTLKFRIGLGANVVNVLDGVGAQVGTDLTLTGEFDTGCNDGHLVGMLVGGTVSSQQADRFSQNDPFMGFIVGYSTERGWFPGADGQLHYQFQGIFQTQPKKDEAPVSEFNNLGLGSVAEGQFVPFLASRKSFDIEARIWADWGLPPSKHVRIGPYFSVAGTTYVSRNELRTDDPIQVEKSDIPTTTATPAATPTATPTATPAAGNGDTVTLDPTQAKIDNDIDLHVGGGLMINVFNRENTKLFMNAQLGYENFEGLAGLNKKPFEGFFGNSRNRIVGKLRIFPSFLNVAYDGPGEGDMFSPMFGVELNAGRGPDQLKFFIGGAVGIGAFKKLFTRPASAAAATPAATPANPPSDSQQ